MVSNNGAPSHFNLTLQISLKTTFPEQWFGGSDLISFSLKSLSQPDLDFSCVGIHEKPNQQVTH